MGRPFNGLGDLIKALNEYESVFAWKNHGGMYGQIGISDIVGVAFGKFLSLELKILKNKNYDPNIDVVKFCTPLQKMFIEKISHKHGISGIIGIHPALKYTIITKPCANNSYISSVIRFKKIGDIIHPLAQFLFSGLGYDF